MDSQEGLNSIGLVMDSFSTFTESRSFEKRKEICTIMEIASLLPFLYHPGLV
jgi:hypothetical protein